MVKPLPNTLMGLLKCMLGNLNGKLPSLHDRQSWNMLFYDLQSHPLISQWPVVQKIQFDWDGPHPTSPALEHCLFTMRTIASTRLDGMIDEDMAEFWGDLYSELDEDTQAFLDAIPVKLLKS